MKVVNISHASVSVSMKTAAYKSEIMPYFDHCFGLDDKSLKLSTVHHSLCLQQFQNSKLLLKPLILIECGIVLILAEFCINFPISVSRVRLLTFSGVAPSRVISIDHTLHVTYFSFAQLQTCQTGECILTFSLHFFA